MKLDIVKVKRFHGEGLTFGKKETHLKMDSVKKINTSVHGSPMCQESDQGIKPFKNHLKAFKKLTKQFSFVKNMKNNVFKMSPFHRVINPK